METIGYALLIMAAFCCLLIAGCAAYLRVLHYYGTYKVVHRMHRQGRIVFRGQFERHLVAARGTVIFEYPTFGWRVLRVWWTPDDIRAIAQVAGIPEESEPGAEVSPFEIWCYDTYLDSEWGDAFIVPLYLLGPAGRRFIQSLSAKYPAMQTIFICSAAIRFFRPEASPKEPPG